MTIFYPGANGGHVWQRRLGSLCQKYIRCLGFSFEVCQPPKRRLVARTESLDSNVKQTSGAKTA